jgi:hypothetical protein
MKRIKQELQLQQNSTFKKRYLLNTTKTVEKKKRKEERVSIVNINTLQRITIRLNPLTSQ